MSKERVVVAVIENENHETVMIKRMKPAGKLVMSFPGGEQELYDSSDAATAARETKEETGLDVSVVRILGEWEHPDTGKTIVYAYCVTDVPGQNAQPGPGKDQLSIREVMVISPDVAIKRVEEQGTNFFPPARELLEGMVERYQSRIEQLNPVTRIDPTRRKKLKKAG